jgi:hypothetical protein
MGICWSEPPAQPQTQVSRSPVYIVDKATAPPYYPPQPQLQSQYTYAVPYQQQQMYTVPYQQQQQQQQQQQMYAYYQARQQYPPPPQQQMGTGTAMLGGFVLGAMVNEMLDPTD